MKMKKIKKAVSRKKETQKQKKIKILKNRTKIKRMRKGIISIIRKIQGKK